VIVQKLDIQLPTQSVPITIKVVSPNASEIRYFSTGDFQAHALLRALKFDWFGLWCLTSLSTIFQLYRVTTVVKFLHENSHQFPLQRSLTTKVDNFKIF
jgi:hypothetical protein